MNFQICFRLRIRSANTLESSRKPVHIRRDWRKFHRLLPFPQGILRISGYTDHFSGKNLPDTGEQTPIMVRRHHCGNKSFQRRTYERTDRRPNKT